MSKTYRITVVPAPHPDGAGAFDWSVVLEDTLVAVGDAPTRQYAFEHAEAAARRHHTYPPAYKEVTYD